MKKARVAQLRLDNHRFKDRRGQFIKNFKGRNALAADWQKRMLCQLGCKREALDGLRFQVANQLIAKLRDAQRSAGTNGATPQVDEGTPAREQQTGD